MERDQVIFDLIEKEHQRQLKGIELIASENFVSDEVMQAMGSCLTNKYAEGYPGKRYYGGCQVVDEVENLAIERIKKLFGAEYANVQPHSGAQANAAVLLAVLKPGDVFMGLNLAHGGHLSQGSAVFCTTPLVTTSTRRPVALITTRWSSLLSRTNQSLSLVVARHTAVSGTTSACVRLPTKLAHCS